MKKMLFFGELPPKTIHGISNANFINLKLLGSSFQIDIIEEYNQFNEHEKVTFRKLCNILKNNLEIFLKSITHSYYYFYTTFSLTTLGSLKTLSALVVFRLFNRGKIVLHIHRGDFFSRFYTYKFNRIITKMVFGLSQKILVLSDSQRIEFESVFTKDFFVLSNTVEIEHAKSSRKNQKSKFLFISNYLIDKGILDLLEVFEKLAMQFPDINLNTYGTFSEQNLKDMMMKFNSAQINIYDTISGQDKFKEISDSDCLILPSWNEGQPIVILEAMSVGTPVIASRVGLIPELLGVDYPYFFEKHNKFSLEETIVKFISKEDSSQISESLKNRYDLFYSQKKHAIDLHNIFT